MNRCLTLLTLLLVPLAQIVFAPPVHVNSEIEPTIVLDYSVDPATLMPGETEPCRPPSQTVQQMRSGRGESG